VIGVARFAVTSKFRRRIRRDAGAREILPNQFGMGRGESRPGAGAPFRPAISRKLADFRSLDLDRDHG